jgi:hypothetical protein
MKKREVIKEKYGVHYELIKKFIDENGWFYTDGFHHHFSFKYDEKGFGVTHRIRPKSLAGIEHNNGWIKIESEEDLPKLTIKYHVVMNGKLSKALYSGKNRWFVNGNDFPKTTEIHGITHYQPIIEPKHPPIY